MVAFFWAITWIASVIAGLILAWTLTSAKGAPQEASGAALAMAFAVIPYVFTRALEAMTVIDWRKAMLKAAEKAAADKADGK